MLLMIKSMTNVLPGCYIIDRKNKVIHNKINDMCIAWMLIHGKINAIHNNINDISITWMLIRCENNPIHSKINDVLPKC